MAEPSQHPVVRKAGARPTKRPMGSAEAKGPPVTPDGRYIVVRGRLWRTANPGLTTEARQILVQALMTARRAVRTALGADDAEALRQARRAVDAAKVGLGERGPVWWPDGAPDLNRHMAENTPYASWFASLERGSTGD